ncbi:hypothetical protein RhiirC2_786575 [Rhizophagus irregularis]|uniref:Uncharacterized protein n=1 Tax=Rhizophagus irregularis TaxID=588596 RepID=A0A2N1MU52_9GLOM|nr:hypothetical protein RhiirC2_786575 [Rhizophagus irregularis]
MQSNEPNQSNQSTQPNKEEPSSTSRSKRCMFCASYSGRIVRRCEKCKKEAYKKIMGMYSKSSVDFTMIALSFYSSKRNDCFGNWMPLRRLEISVKSAELFNEVISSLKLEELMDEKPFERFHANWELLYSVLLENGKSSSTSHSNPKNIMSLEQYVINSNWNTSNSDNDIAPKGKQLSNEIFTTSSKEIELLCPKIIQVIENNLIEDTNCGYHYKTKANEFEIDI